MTTVILDQDNADEIADVLVGRKIIEAVEGNFTYTGEYGYPRAAEGRLTLDDGTVLYVRGHEGGCSCGAGDYYLSKLVAVDNIITSVRVESDPDDDYYEADRAYRIFVFADATEINAVEFLGSDGNGYYGTGFELAVIKP